MENSCPLILPRMDKNIRKINKGDEISANLNSLFRNVCMSSLGDIYLQSLAVKQVLSVKEVRANVTCVIKI